MEGTITYDALGWIVVFIIIVAVGVFAAIALKSLNQLLKNLNALIEKNMEHLNRIIPNVSAISGDSVVIVGDLRKTVDETGRALDVITRTATETVLNFNKTADRVGGYAVLIGELTKILVDVFKTEKLR